MKLKSLIKMKLLILFMFLFLVSLGVVSGANPSVTIVSPTAITYSTSQIDFNLTVTDADTYPETCMYSLDNFVTNYSMTNDTASNFYNSSLKTMLSMGSNTVNFTCNDTNGNINMSEGISFTMACLTPYEGMQITESTTFCPGTYYLNGSATGAIQIGADNVVLDGNGSTIVGNSTNTAIMRDAYYTNITIRNCNIQNYWRGIYHWNGDNWLIYNNAINTTNFGIQLRAPINTSIYNNTIYGGNRSNTGTAGIELQNFGRDNNIFDNNINDFRDGIRIKEQNNATQIYNNFINNSGNDGIWVHLNSTGANVYNNTIYNSYWNGIAVHSNFSVIDSNIIIFNKELSGHHCLDANPKEISPTVFTMSYTNFTNNICNISATFDINFAEGTGMYIQNATNLYIANNEFNNVSNFGIGIDGLSNSFNNTFENNFISISPLSSHYCLSLSAQDNSFRNNTFGNCNGKTIRISFDKNSSFYNNIAKEDFIFINNTGGTNSLRFYNISNALIYYSNNSIAESTDINSNDGNINITLTPNNYSYVLDEYNVTEGVDRENSPLWYHGSSNTIKYIMSNLTNTINTTLSFYVDNCSISTISFVSAQEGYILSNFTSWTCTTGSSSVVTLTGLNLESSSGYESDLNVSFGEGITSMEFRPTAYYGKFWPEGQTWTKGIFNISNTGISTVNVGIRINQTQTGWKIECNNQTTESWIELNTTLQTIYSGLEAGASFETWCRAVLSNPDENYKGKILFEVV